MQFVTRVDQLAKELKNTVAATIGGVQKSTMKALHGVMSIKGGKMSAVSLFFVFSFFGSNSFHENIVFCFVLFFLTFSSSSSSSSSSFAGHG